MLALDGNGNLTKQRKLGRRSLSNQKMVNSGHDAASKSARASSTAGGVAATARRIDSKVASNKHPYGYNTDLIIKEESSYLGPRDTPNELFAEQQTPAWSKDTVIIPNLHEL